MSDFNAAIIDEFRANGGKVGGQFEGAQMLLLHTTGARSGEERVHPIVYQVVGDDLAVFGSKAGAPTHPAWFHNLVAHPDATIEIGPDTVPVRARVTEGDERERIWARQKELMPGFADYEAKTTAPSRSWSSSASDAPTDGTPGPGGVEAGRSAVGGGSLVSDGRARGWGRGRRPGGRPHPHAAGRCASGRGPARRGWVGAADQGGHRGVRAAGCRAGSRP